MGFEELIMRKMELLNSVIEVNSKFDDEDSKNTVKVAKRKLYVLTQNL